MTPFERRGKSLGRKGKESLAGCRCPHCRRGSLVCFVGQVEVIGQLVEAVANRCPLCGELLLTESEFRRVAPKRRRNR